MERAIRPGTDTPSPGQQFQKLNLLNRVRPIIEKDVAADKDDRQGGNQHRTNIQEKDIISQQLIHSALVLPAKHA